MNNEKTTAIKGEFYAHGKVLLSAEYAVLDGARAIALPTKFGQSLQFKKTKSSEINWIAKDMHGDTWFSAKLSLFDFSATKTSDEEMASKLQNMLKNAVRLNSEFLSKWDGFKIETRLEFPRKWGLGSSSSLTYLVAQWADVHPLLLHFRHSKGSGYDVACAGADGPISYQLKDEEINWSEIDFDPKFKSNIYFVYLGKKQSSEEGISYYQKQLKDKKSFVKASSQLTDEFEKAKTLDDFIHVLNEHEKLVSKTLALKSIHCEFFNDLQGGIKSLGAWGGDFALVASPLNLKELQKYFSSKGLNDVYSYSDFIL